MKKNGYNLISILLLCFYLPAIGSDYTYKADSILRLMTLEEKIGQLNQYAGDAFATGPIVRDTNKLAQVKAGLVGSMLNVIGAEQTRAYQEVALQSRLGIPLIFALDVIHGFRTIFPIPLAEAATFDLDVIETSARWAATEAAAAGIHWTFAPMVDISWDARWGRVMEGAGEDPYYGSMVAKARVKGFQGLNLADTTTIMACAKHFAAYGAPVAGKDYNSVDMSLSHFMNFYMPPYLAAKEAGVATFMTAFSDFNNIPCSAHDYLLRHMLKGKWEYSGFVVSDWGSIGEMVNHRYALDAYDAAHKALVAGVDMDMESHSYINNLITLVKNGEVDETYVDDAVRRILIKKYELGLFDDPFRYCDINREKRIILSPQIRAAARDVAKRSIVLLKNETNVLPFATTKRIALVGALADSKIDMSGFWANERNIEEMVTLKEGLIAKGFQVNYIPAYDLSTKELHNTSKTIREANKADVIVVCVGERWNESGEAKSMGNIEIAAQHQWLVQQLASLKKPLVTIVMGGRPLIFNTIKEYSPAILFTWWLGTEAGNAIADVIAGEYNPSARLPMTFPKHIAQLPIYYNYKSTGRPEKSRQGYTTGYNDIDYKPAYPFGYGLSYSNFEMGELMRSDSIVSRNNHITIETSVTNISDIAGETVVQLYVHDKVASITRPIKEFRGFKKIALAPHEAKKVIFNISSDLLGFYNNEGNYTIEDGEFTIMLGVDPHNLKSVEIQYIEEGCEK